MKTNWKKVASVTPGGKPFFWFRRTETERQWKVWNRATGQWQIESEKL